MSQFVNPLDVSDVSDSEQYLGCRRPDMLEPWEQVTVSDGKKAWAEDEEAALLARKNEPHYDGKEYGVYSRLDAERERASAKPASPLTRQVGGDHYKTASIQPVEYIRANNLNFFEGNAVKYITRHRVKGGKADLEKAIHYLEMEIANSYGK
jgi:hypothetical protein